MPLHVALVGFGLSGRYLQAPFIVANPKFRLKTVVTSGSNTPKEIYNWVQVSHDFESVLADPDIDLVSITTPNETHFDYARRALLAGKHVLVEKPMTATAAEAQELITLARQQNRVLSAYQNRRFDGDFMTVQKVVQNGWLGDLLSYEAHFDRYKPILNPKKWKETPGPASGILYDLGSHLLDQALVLFGRPQHVTGEVFTQRAGTDIDDAFDVRLDYGPLKVRLRASLLVREVGPRYVLHGTKGSFVKYGLDVQEDTLKAGAIPGTPGFGKEPESQWGILNTELAGVPFRGKLETEAGNFGLLFQNLYEAIVEKKPLLVKPEEVVEQLRILEQVKSR
ncbi:MAG: Gfo/Idh/MocA family oxidoreductase [Cytophagaceae bacterium]|nr:Gfo/Idh/MocA family oxidoreductase [Cytophagaceae bacterium]